MVVETDWTWAGLVNQGRTGSLAPVGMIGSISLSGFGPEVLSSSWALTFDAVRILVNLKNNECGSYYLTRSLTNRGSLLV